MMDLPIPPSLGLAALWTDLYGRGPALAQHGERVGWLAGCLAAAAGLDEAERMALRWAGRLHDYGKLALPPALWQHPGPLSPAAWDLMRRHPAISADLIRTRRDSRPSRPLWPGITSGPMGTGYPLGLTGAAISVLGAHPGPGR